MGVVATKSRRATTGSPAGADNVALVQLDIATSGRTPAAAAETANITDETLEPPGTAIRTGVARRKAKRTVHMGAAVRKFEHGFSERVRSIKHRVNRTVHAVEETVHNILHTGCPHGGAHSKDAAEHEKCRQDLLHAKKAVARLEEAQNSQKEDDGSDIQGELARLKAENEELTRRQDELAERANNLRNQLETSVGDKERVRRLKLDYDQELTELKQRDEERLKELTDLRERDEERKQELANKQKDYEQSMKALTKLEARFKESETDRKELANKQKDCEQSMKGELANWQERFNNLRNELGTSAGDKEVVRRLRLDYDKELTDLRERDEERKQELVDKDKEMTALRKNDEEHLKARAEMNAQLKTCHKEAVLKIKLDQELIDLKQRDEEREKVLKDRKASLEASEKNQEALWNELTKQKDAMRDEVKEKTDCQSRLKKTDFEHKAAIKEKDMAHKSWNACSDEKVACMNQLVQMSRSERAGPTDTVKDLNTRLMDEVRTLKERLRTGLQQAETAKNDAVAEVAEVKKQKELLNKELYQQRKKVGEVKMGNRVIETTAIHCQSDASQCKSEKLAMQYALNGYKKVLDENFHVLALPRLKDTRRVVYIDGLQGKHQERACLCTPKTGTGWLDGNFILTPKCADHCKKDAEKLVFMGNTTKVYHDSCKGVLQDAAKKIFNNAVLAELFINLNMDMIKPLCDSLPEDNQKEKEEA